LVVLLPTVLLVRGRSVWVMLIGILVLLGLVMGLCVPWRRALMSKQQGLAIRVLTCNIDGSRLIAGDLGRLIEATRPDVVMLQEWTSRHQQGVFADQRWNVLRDGELCIGSRHPIRKVVDVLDQASPRGAATCYRVQTPAGGVYVVNLHLMSPHVPLDAVLERRPGAPAKLTANSRTRLEESRIVSRFAEGFAGPIVLAGDFNMPTDSAGYQRHWSAFTDAFSIAGLGFGSTYHTRLVRARIDHVLGGDGWRVRRCWVGPNVGSPHRPVIADLEREK
jgi:endonuclease/exonuclease/phosphatase (EEP) superfamily protein YafD